MKLKNVMFGIVGGLFALSVATISCSKSSTSTPPPSKPVISSATTATGTVGTAFSYTITASNSPTSYTAPGLPAGLTLNTTTGLISGTPTAAAVTPVTISAINGGGTGTATLTITINPAVVLPTSNDVAPANLIAHWTFDNTKAEDKSGIVPTTNGTTSYTAGKIGGANGALAFNGANLIYPTIDTLNKPTTFAGGYTLSMWAKLPVQPLYTSIWQLNGNIGDIFGLIGLAQRKNPNDTLDFDGAMTNVDGSGTHSTAFSTALEGGTSGFGFSDTSWVFLTMSYDSTTKMINYYGNGALRGSKSIGAIIAPGAQFELVTTNSNPGVSISSVSFGSLDVNPPYINAVNPAPAVWQSPNLITGTVIDDTRLFNKTLSQTEITNLYNYGLAGR